MAGFGIPLGKPSPIRFILTSFFGLACLLTAAAGEVTVRIIQTTDLHGSIDHGRLAKTAFLVEQETRSAGGPEKSLRIDCGDLIQGTYAMTLPMGRQLMIQFLNRLDFDVFVPGNHDFEFGSAELLPLLRQFRGSVLAANLDWPDAPVRPWRMFRRNQLNIAVIGITYPALRRMFIPPVLGPARPLDVERRLETVMPEIMRAKPDLILLAIHGGGEVYFSSKFDLYGLIRKYPQIDLVLCGHSHQTDPGSSMGRSSCRIQAPARANGIAVADFVFDTGKKRIVSLKTRILSIDGCREHPDLKKQIAAVSGKSFRISRQPVANLPFELCPPGKKERSSALTRLYGQAIADHTGAEIVFYGVNSSFTQPAGSLNRFQLYRLMPYQDFPVLVHLSGSEIRRILQEQLAVQRKKGSYQAPFGLNFSASRRGLNSLVLARSGAPVDNAKTYPAAFSSYIFSGSGRCPVLHSIVQSKKPRYFPLPVRRIVEDYLGKKYPAANP